MKIAIIGTGNVGGALAKRFAGVGHQVVIAARFPLSSRSQALSDDLEGFSFLPVNEAVDLAQLIVISVPAKEVSDVVRSMGDTSGKWIIDTMNIVMGNGPEGFSSTADAILANTQTRDVVKCFNTTGFENMLNPIYHGKGIDMFVSGSSIIAKEKATQLALEIGFGKVWDMGGDEMFQLQEKLALVWINQAIFKKAGRDIALNLISR